MARPLGNSWKQHRGLEVKEREGRNKVDRIVMVARQEGDVSRARPRRGLARGDSDPLRAR